VRYKVRPDPVGPLTVKARPAKIAASEIKTRDKKAWGFSAVLCVSRRLCGEIPVTAATAEITQRNAEKKIWLRLCCAAACSPVAEHAEH
jgi:hypothetical protein